MELVKPETVGFSSQRLNRFDSLLQGYIDSGYLPNAQMLVARQGEVAYFKNFGMRNYAQGLPVEDDTIFRIYSMTKPIVSVATMMLLERGCFALQDNIADYIPEFGDLKVYVNENERADLESPMTIQHLLSHTAGVIYADRDGPVEDLYREAGVNDHNQSLAQMIGRLGSMPLAFQPGKGWRYSMAVDVLGYLVQVVSGKPLETFLQEEIFEPLGMVDTAFYVLSEKLDRFSEMYGWGRWLIGLNYARDYTRPPGWPSGGGGLVSTMADYLRFCKMLANGGEFNGTRLLGRKTIDVMRMNHTPTHLFPLTISSPMYGYGFGLGFCVMLDVALSGRLTSVGEYGWSGAAGTHFWIDPVEDIIAIFMTQTFFRDEAWNPVVHREYRVDLRTLVYQALE